jgi:hypothetical protein
MAITKIVAHSEKFTTRQPSNSRNIKQPQGQGARISERQLLTELINRHQKQNGYSLKAPKGLFCTSRAQEQQAKLNRKLKREPIQGKSWDVEGRESKREGDGKGDKLKGAACKQNQRKKSK